MIAVHCWRDGLSRVLGAPAVLVGVFAMTLIVALPLAGTMHLAMNAHLGRSLAADAAADGVNYDWWQEFAGQSGAQSLGSTFTPSILGFATTLDSVSSLLDARPIVPAIAMAVAFYLVTWTFLSGGILDRYARGHRTGAYGFFSASGVFFFRFLRLSIFAGAMYWFLFMHVHRWLFDTWYTRMTRDLSVESTALLWRLLMYAIFAGLLAAVTTLFDYIRVRAVVEDRRSMLVAALAGARFVTRQPGRVVVLYLLNGTLLLAIVAIWSFVAPGAGSSGVSMWVGVVATQVYVAARLGVKLQFMAAEVALFQRSLAHWGYVAAEVRPRREPPVVDTL